MTMPLQPSAEIELVSVLAGLREEDGPAPLVDVLVRHGALARFAVPADNGTYRYAANWREVLDVLVALGGIDLSLARLFEGHLNALQLVSLYGTAEQRRRVLRTVMNGGMLGVWGADGDPPLLREATGAGYWRLSGSKRYASGVGLLRLALVPVNEADGAMQLLLLDVDAPERADASTWNMRGMRRSVSGSYRFDGLAIDASAIVGTGSDYKREPYFVGGIWRCAAAQLGAIEAIVRAMVEELARTGRDAHPLQIARIGTAIMEARTVRLWVEDTAARVEAGGAARTDAETENAVALSAYGRLVAERAAMAVIDLAERSLGLGSFAAGHPVEALTRDLSVYIRQANPDAVLIQHGRVLARNTLA